MEAGKKKRHSRRDWSNRDSSGSWDIDAFLIFMNIIHCQFHAVPWEINLDMLAKVTVLANYYQCLKALDVFKDMWIEYHRNFFSETYLRDTILWLWIS